MSSHPLLREALGLHAAGKYQPAVLAFERVRGLQPNCWEAYHYAAMSLLMLRRYQDAFVLLEKAVLLVPDRTESGVALGLSLLALGRAGEAEPMLRGMTVRFPKAAEVFDSLGLVLRSLGRFDDSVDAHKSATRLAPKTVAYWVNLGDTLLNTNRQREAQDAFIKACSLDPKNSKALSGRAICLFRMHRVAESVDWFRKVLAAQPRLPDIRTNLLLALQSVEGLSKEAIFAEHKQFGAIVGNPVRQLAPRSIGPETPIRVGIVSSDLHTHSVSYFILPLLRHAKENGIELIVYHDGSIYDEVSERVRSLASLWRSTAGQLHPVLERQILADAPDVLIDLAGHAGSNRLQVFARRVAPIQVTYLGYPDTTGVPAMDFRFVDAITDPVGVADAYATERLIRFSETAWCFDAPAVPLPPARIQGSGPVFGCFNKFAKVTDEVLKEWALLLSEIPDSRLLIKSVGLGRADIEAGIADRMKKAGLSMDRVELLGMVPGVDAHLALYGKVDVALDTFPYNGTTTTCEALWMGVPVVTLAGNRHVSRVGMSLLSSIGRPEWEASSKEEYRNIATDLARRAVSGDPGLSRSEIRAAFQRSALMDSEKQARRFWTAVRSCCRASQPGEMPK